MENKDVLGIGIHGAGWVASAHAAAWKKNPHARIVSVGDLHREIAEKFVQDQDLDCRIHDRFEDLLADPEVDIVDICSPNQVHVPQGVAAAEAGKHILVEIPYQFNVDLVGTKGTLRDNRVWSKSLLPGQNDWTTMAAIAPNSGDVLHHPFQGEIDHLVDSIRDGRDSHCNMADAYLSHELCMAIDRSAAEGGRPVRLPLDDVS